LRRAHDRSATERRISQAEFAVAATSPAWQAAAFGELPAMIVDLVSPLPRRECVSRLKMKTDPAWGGAGTVVGSVRETSFRLRKRIYYRNSFQYSLSGELIDDHGRPRLHCSIGLHPLVRIFFTVWFGGVLLGCGMVSIWMARAYAHGALPPNWWPGAGVPFLMLEGGIAILMFGKHLARDEPAFLIVFLRRGLDAQESQGG
jgi:hypothetical protein